MQIILHRRAEIALRTLSLADQKQVDRALDALRAMEMKLLYQNKNVHKLATGFSARRIDVYKAGQRLRLILEVSNDACVIQDIVDHDHLQRMLRSGGAP